MDKETGISAGVGFLTGLRGTPWWMAVGITIGMEYLSREIAHTNPSLLPGYSPKPREKMVSDIAVGMIGWWAGKEVEGK